MSVDCKQRTGWIAWKTEKGSRIRIEMNSDFTHVESGRNFHSEQVGVYKVSDGKVVSSRFYYGYGE